MDDSLRAEDARLAAQVERLRAELAVAREQQTATGEILRVIASSPDDVQPVLDTIVRNAVVLCNAIFSGQLRAARIRGPAVGVRAQARARGSNI